MDQPSVISPPATRTIALVGNPNCGKSSLFNVLSGLNQKVGNFPGVTVERKTATLRPSQDIRCTLIDLPGVNSLYPASQDERITYDVLKEKEHPDYPDLVVLIVDGTQLRRGLMLATQVIDMGLPTLLALNMMDLVTQRGYRIDSFQLSQLLGVPVVPISVRKGTGLDSLKGHMLGPLPELAKPIMEIPMGMRPMIKSVQKHAPSLDDYHAYQALLDQTLAPEVPAQVLDPIREHGGIEQDAGRQLITNELLVRLDRADSLMESVLIDPPTAQEIFTEKLDKVLMHPIAGYAVFVGILLLIFQALFAWASMPMDAIDALFGSIAEGLQRVLPAHWATDLLTDGLIAGLGGIVIFVPQIALLFLFITLLEESGYMARAVFLMDRIMQPFGFSGRSLIPLMGGMACAIPSIMMTRTIANRNERLITILVTPLMSCSARLPVYTLLIAMFIPAGSIVGIDQRGLFLTAIYLLGFVLALLIAWVFKKAFRYESKGHFVMELPPYRMPRLRNVGMEVYRQSATFVTEAGKVILVISLILWVMTSYGPSDTMQQIEDTYAEQLAQPDLSGAERASLATARESEKLNHSYAAILGKAIEPVIRPLGYDWKIGISLIASFAAREVFVGTMSVIYQQDNPEDMDEGEQEQGRLTLIERLQQETHPGTDKPVYTPAVVLSLIIFYAIAMQCMSTLAVTKKEVGWKWAGVMLVYLTALAYVGAFAAYQLMA